MTIKLDIKFFSNKKLEYFIIDSKNVIQTKFYNNKK